MADPKTSKVTFTAPSPGEFRSRFVDEGGEGGRLWFFGLSVEATVVKWQDESVTLTDAPQDLLDELLSHAQARRWRIEETVLSTSDGQPARWVRRERVPGTGLVERTIDQENPSQTRVFDEEGMHLFTLLGHHDNALCVQVDCLIRRAQKRGRSAGRAELGRDLCVMIGAAVEGEPR